MVRDITHDPEFLAACNAKEDSEEGTYFCTTFTPEALAFYRMCVPPNSVHVLQAAMADVRARLQSSDRNRGIVYRHYVAILEVMLAYAIDEAPDQDVLEPDQDE
jgi:hypothetical protein